MQIAFATKTRIHEVRHGGRKQNPDWSRRSWQLGTVWACSRVQTATRNTIIVAVSSRSLEKAKEIGRTYDIPRCYGDMQHLIDDAEVDLVAVLSPAPEHASAVRAVNSGGEGCLLRVATHDEHEGLQRTLAPRGASAGFGILWGFSGPLDPAPFTSADLLSEGYVGQLRSVRMHVSMAGFGPVRSASLDWTIPAKNFSHVLSIYGGHFMDMLFHAVGQPATITSLVRTQFPKLTSSTGESFPNETPDGVMVMGTLQNGAMFQIQLEGGKRNQTGLQIDLTGTDGDLQVTNEKAFVTKHNDLIRGAQGDETGLERVAHTESFQPAPPNRT